MGSHVWEGQCPYCGFEEMIFSSYDSFYFEINCQICGYSKWTEEKVPDNQDVVLAKQAMNKMGSKEIQKAINLYYKDNTPLVARLKKRNF